VHLKSKVADLLAEFSIPKQGHNVMLVAWIFDSFAQHGDQMSLGTTSPKFVDDVNVKHGLQVYMGQKFGISGVSQLPQATQINGDSDYYLQRQTAVRTHAGGAGSDSNQPN